MTVRSKSFLVTTLSDLGYLIIELIRIFSNINLKMQYLHADTASSRHVNFTKGRAPKL